MTRGQRKAHRAAWVVLGVVLALAAAHALASRRAAWARAEAIRSPAAGAPSDEPR